MGTAIMNMGKTSEIQMKKGQVSEDVIELLIYHQPSVKPSLTLRPFGILGYVAGHSLTTGIQLGNPKWVRLGVKWVPMAIDSCFPPYKNIYWFLLNLT